MNYKEAKAKVLSMIEEIDEAHKDMTRDPDIAAKLPYTFTQVMYALARFKKIPKFVEIEVLAGQTVEFLDIESALGYEVYQIDRVCGPAHRRKAAGTILKFLESGTAEIDCFVYPEKITPETPDNYEFDLSPDALEILPYGVAADLLKSDASADYGAAYADQYEQMLQRLDSRYHMPSIYINGGVKI